MSMLTAHDLLTKLQQLPPDELNLPIALVTEAGYVVENLDCVSVARLPGKQYGPTGGPYAVILDGE